MGLSSRPLVVTLESTWYKATDSVVLVSSLPYFGNITLILLWQIAISSSWLIQFWMHTWGKQANQRPGIALGRVMQTHVGQCKPWGIFWGSSEGGLSSARTAKSDTARWPMWPPCVRRKEESGDRPVPIPALGSLYLQVPRLRLSWITRMRYNTSQATWVIKISACRGAQVCRMCPWSPTHLGWNSDCTIYCYVSTLLTGLCLGFHTWKMGVWAVCLPPGLRGKLNEVWYM